MSPVGGERGGSGNCVYRLLDAHLDDGRGDLVAVRSDQRVMTYIDLYRESCRAANMFLSAGIRPRDRVVVLMPDSPEYIACVLGLMRVEAVPVPVSTEVSRDAYLHIAADCQPALTVVGAEQADRVAGVDVPIFTWARGGANADERSYSARVAAENSDCPLRRVRPDAPAVIQYTSGSTGAPKGVVHLHRGLLAVLNGMITRLGLDTSEVCFSAAKLSFGYGFGNSLLFPLGSGASTVLLDARADASRALDIVLRHHVTVLFGVPTLYSAMLTAAADHPNLDLRDLRLCVSAGEPLPSGIARQWRQRFGLDLVNGLGSTECLHIFIASEPGRTPEGSAGTVVAGYQAEIRDDAGYVLGAEQVGHLWIKGDANSAGYWNRPEDTARSMADGWIRTGDQMYRDENGVYYFVARSDDLLNIGGFKVAPTEVEECLLEHPLVKGCAVVGTNDENGLTVLTAFVLLNEDATETVTVRRQLRTHVSGILPSYKCPRDFRFVAELPTTPTGKVGRQILRKLLTQANQQMSHSSGQP
jgi:benzoate-CoA ligase family protein